MSRSNVSVYASAVRTDVRVLYDCKYTPVRALCQRQNRTSVRILFVFCLYICVVYVHR